VKIEKPLPAPAWLLEQVRQAKGRTNPEEYKSILGLVTQEHLHTVCESACCPNSGRCFSNGTATFMIMGNICTRACRFCAVEHGHPLAVDPDEPERVASAVEKLCLEHVVITSVTRDDLGDGGADHFARVTRSIKQIRPRTGVEVLVPDFAGKEKALDIVLEARPEVLGHNMETVPRLYHQVRPGASYEQSLELLNRAAGRSAPTLRVKSGFMLGLGETADEIRILLHEIYDTGCRMVTIGQYLAPSLRHYPVQRYVPPDEFSAWAMEAKQMGFQAVASAPLVRSSFNAGFLYQEAIAYGR
jgi:lipoic acid synthetase